MADDLKAPERIWADDDHWIDYAPTRSDRVRASGEYTAYIRADLYEALEQLAATLERERDTAVKWAQEQHANADRYAARAEAADRIEALVKEKERLHRTVDAAAKIGRIIGFLGDDEDRISAFIECCGPDLIDHARAVLAEFEGGKDE